MSPTTVGYSGTPLVEKLGIEPDHVIAILDPPPEIRDTVREVVLPTGLVDNEVCAISDVWSGLRVVHRRENRR